MSNILSNIRNSAIYSLNSHTKKLSMLQEQSATGSTINRVSDNPSDAYKILNLQSKADSYSTYIDSLENTISILGTSSNVITNIMTELSSVKVDLTEIISGIYNEDQRNNIVERLNSALDTVVSLVNTDYLGQYLFSGTGTATVPYSVEYTDGKITSVNYQGSFQERSVEIAPGIKSNAFYIGDKVLSLSDRGGLSFIGAETGVSQGQGTSSLKGYCWLEVSQPVSGTYRLTVDGGASYVDVAVPPGGVNTKVTNSVTGEVLYLDTTGITSAGVELVNADGTGDIFDTLITLRDVFANKKNLGDDQIEEMRLTLLDSLDGTYSLMSRSSAAVGSKMSYLESTKDMLTDMKLNTQDDITLIEQADIAQIAIDLTEMQTLYQMSLSVAGKMMSLSIFDFI